MSFYTTYIEPALNSSASPFDLFLAVDWISNGENQSTRWYKFTSEATPSGTDLMTILSHIMNEMLEPQKQGGLFYESSIPFKYDQGVSTFNILGQLVMPNPDDDSLDYFSFFIENGELNVARKQIYPVNESFSSTGSLFLYFYVDIAGSAPATNIDSIISTSFSAFDHVTFVVNSDLQYLATNALAALNQPLLSNDNFLQMRTTGTYGELNLINDSSIMFYINLADNQTNTPVPIHIDNFIGNTNLQETIGQSHSSLLNVSFMAAMVLMMAKGALGGESG